MSDGTETIVMPECETLGVTNAYAPPDSYGKVLADQREQAAERLMNMNSRFALWDSLDQETKDKLDQITGYKHA